MPKTDRPSYTYPFRDMEVGDSFVGPIQARAAASTYGTRNGWKFVSQDCHQYSPHLANLMRLPDYVEKDRPRVKFREQVLRYVADFQAEHRRSPLHKEIAAGVGVNTVPSIWRALKLLEDEGSIKRHRSEITLLEKP